MAKMSESAVPSLLFTETANASITTPAAGKAKLFRDTDNVLKWKDEAGTVTSTSGVPKLYDFTITGADQASIDTFVDGTTAANFSGYDVLEVFMILRTDDAGAVVDALLTVNNDTSAIYDREQDLNFNLTSSPSATVAAANWTLQAHGSGGLSGQPSMVSLVIPGYAATVFNKVAQALVSIPDSTAGNNRQLSFALGYRSTSAITRVKIAGSGAAKLKIGSRLIVYAR